MTSKPLALTLVAFMALTPVAVARGPKDESPGNSGDHKTTICHHAGPTKTFTLVVDDHAVPAHLAHGDTLGPCPPVTPPVEPPKEEPTPEQTPGVVETPATPEAPGAPAEKPGQVVGGVKKGHKHIARGNTPQARAERRAARKVADRAVQQRADRAAAKETELPHTGFPAALLALAGISALGGGSFLRRRS